MNNNQNSNKTLFISTIFFIVIAIIFFGVQNFVISGKKVETMTVYVANKDINAYDLLSTDLFTPTSVPKEGNSILQSQYATSVADFASMYAGANIKKGEILSKSRIVADNDEKGLDYTILLDAPYLGDIAYGDNVKVYAMDSTSGSIDVLYKRKKIYKSKVAATEQVSQEEVATNEANNEANGTNYEAVSTMYIRVSAAELKEYYNSKKSKELIVVPILNDSGTSSSSDSSDDNSDDELVSAFASASSSSKTTNHVVSGDNETLETIAKQYNVTTVELAKANPSIDGSTKILSKGTEVAVPTATNSAE